MREIPDSHPRKSSLLSRQKMVDAGNKGLLADSAMIAHGRGEAFDYLLGEVTIESASRAIREAAARLKNAKSPVISVNGNTVVLAGEQLIRVAAVLGCPIEVNLYYRTPERVSGLLAMLREQRERVSHEGGPSDFEGEWGSAVMSVPLIGEDPDFRIAGLEGSRSFCTEEGIGLADLVLVPLEDGDRCGALVNSGKDVIVIDLNPLSRSSLGATVTIVDEVSRSSEVLLGEILRCRRGPAEWDNIVGLRDALSVISDSVGRI